MFPVHNGVAFGISHKTSDPYSIYIWADNQTDK